MARSLPAARRRPRWIILAIVVVLAIVFGRSLCSLIIDYFWWREMGQVATWVRMSAYRYATGIVQWLVVFVAVWLAHARGMKYAGTSVREERGYAWLATLAIAVVAFFIAAASF